MGRPLQEEGKWGAGPEGGREGGREAEFIALPSPLCSTGELGIKVCGLIKFSAVQLKRQLVYTAHLHSWPRGAGGPE